MPATIWGIVKDGRIAPSSPLPEGAKVEIRLCETPPGEMPQDLLDELAAWQLAGAEAIELVERLAEEGDAHETK